MGAENAMEVRQKSEKRNIDPVKSVLFICVQGEGLVLDFMQSDSFFI